MKFQSFLKYFDWLEERAVEHETAKLKETAAMTATMVTPSHETETTDSNGDGGGGGGGGSAGGQLTDTDAKNTIKISRKVFSGKQWLTIEDWLECSQPLCRLEIKHEGRIERSPNECVQTIFASARLGGNILSNGWTQVGVGVTFTHCPATMTPNNTLISQDFPIDFHRNSHKINLIIYFRLLSVLALRQCRNAWHLHCIPN